jgi:hypothetical protein
LSGKIVRTPGIRQTQMQKKRWRKFVKAAAPVAILIDQPERDALRRGVTVEQPAGERVSHDSGPCEKLFCCTIPYIERLTVISIPMFLNRERNPIPIFRISQSPDKSGSFEMTSKDFGTTSW